ncbi:hypothetical protein [Streptosporangium sandarakinum]|uniref:hypothetical protein n=1 Tax=Streptosporangium sandarakinum TaxID=1260955 RepID=UPI00379746CE
MTATETITRSTDAAVVAGFLVAPITPALRAELIADLRTSLPVEDMRAIYAAANRRPRPVADWREDIEQIGEISVVPCDHGGWRIHHDPTGYILDTEGCWVSSEDVDVTTIHAEETTIWSHRGLAIAAALATL